MVNAYLVMEELGLTHIESTVLQKLWMFKYTTLQNYIAWMEFRKQTRESLACAIDVIGSFVVGALSLQISRHKLMIV